MSKTYKFILGLLVLLIGWFIYNEAMRPAPLDWRPSYSHDDKIPLGTAVFYQNLKEIVPAFHDVKKPPYVFLGDSSATGTYVVVNRDMPFNKTATKRLLHWVEKGNTVFVSAHADQKFLDTLNVEADVKRLKKSLTNHAEFNLVNPGLKADSAFVFNHDAALQYFETTDSASYRILGQGRLQKKSSEPSTAVPNFIDVPFGKGHILLHSSPQAFSNYFMLHKHNYTYVENVLAYLDLDKPIYYDIYHDPTKITHTSPLYILLNNRYLKWAYYLIIIAVIAFVIFEGKRKQQAIKVIPPVKNMSYDYTRTIAGLYFDKKDHTAIAHKMIAQFLQYIRMELRTEVDKIDRKLVDRLTGLTHNTTDEVKALFDQINHLQNARFVSKNELKTLNNSIYKFKQKTYE